tara:strand:+ start:2172 stop:2393 length:222 start_codon:yes stop_codon:yes gene_type:complete
MAKGKVETLVEEIQVNQKLQSPRQVFELYPYIGELYYREKQGEEISESEFLNMNREWVRANHSHDKGKLILKG